MNTVNHFLTAFALLLVLFHTQATLIQIFLFAAVFGAAVDLDYFFQTLLKKPPTYRRTWIQEPLSLLILALPIGLLLGQYKPIFLNMTLIPFSLHILLDLITIHTIRPLAPFSSKELNLGFFKSWPHQDWYGSKEKLAISEAYLFLPTAIISLLLLYRFY